MKELPSEDLASFPSKPILVAGSAILSKEPDPDIPGASGLLGEAAPPEEEAMLLSNSGTIAQEKDSR